MVYKLSKVIWNRESFMRNQGETENKRSLK